MNGVDPDPSDIAGLAECTVDEQMLHLSAAAALRQVLMSRPSSAPAGPRRGRGGPDQPLIRDAYYLALALADAAGGNDEAVVERTDTRWVEPAALVGRLQVRFLEQVCAQVEMTANHLPVSGELTTVMSRALLRDGGLIAPGTVLLPDHAAPAERRSGVVGWMHATSTVDVAGRAAAVVVDAGPETLTAAWAARIAAPIAVSPAAGRWPVTVVEDCLTMCADAVRWWVASMTRQLSGEGDEDLILRIATPLRKFLVSPASAAIAAAHARSGVGELQALSHPPAVVATFGPVHEAVAGSPAALPLRAFPGGAQKTGRGGALTSLNTSGVPGRELSPDTTLADCVKIAEVHSDEMTLLSVAPVSDLAEEVDVTVNFSTPEWQDVTTLVADLREAGAVQLTAGVLGWTDRDAVSGAGHRLTLRARVRAGVPLQLRDGYAVLLPPGTRLTLIGADVSKSHCTLYAVQGEPPAETDRRRGSRRDIAAA
ncbi:hypothetical protein [Mycolicibacterium sp.]|uniref:hypothetical protein n=1 Tax=Mycolicibacterium sp. TaxID=2320850 RepID=UPI00356052CF